MSKDEVLAAALQLSDEDRADLFDDLLASMRPEEIPDWHMKIIEERVAEMDAHPERLYSWEEVQAELKFPK